MVGWAVATWFSLLSLVVAVAAFAFSVASRTSASRAKRVADVQWRASERQGYTEGVDFGGFGDAVTITLVNLGPHRARNVSIEVMATGSAGLPHNFIYQVHDATIDAGDRRVCGMQFAADFTPPPVLLITWIDGRKGVQRYERVLQLTDGFGPAINPDLSQVEQGTQNRRTGEINWDKSPGG